MNELKQIAEFQKCLANYQPSDGAKHTLSQTKMALLVGPTSSGRNTIINHLLTTGKYHAIVSDTTRLPRENNGILEQDGREYWFRNEAELLADLQSGKFLEAAIIHGQQVSGISIRELEAAQSEGKIAINEIEVVGADNIHTTTPDAFFFFVLPPSFEEWMVRMSTRGTLPVDEVKRRLQSAVMEIQTALDRDYYIFMVNDTFVHTARDIDEVIATGQVVQDQQVKNRQLAAKLMEDTAAYLAGE